MLEYSGGDPLLFMKVGTHAKEDLGAIIERKKREIHEAGFAMWGYGGNTCHPTTMVQPFARQFNRSPKPILLVMQPMDSKHFAEQVRAAEYSVDGTSWKTMHPAINVLGSRYALCIQTLEHVEERLDLGRTSVAIGNSRGRQGSEYVKGRVDKACLRFDDESDGQATEVDIGLVAEIVEPFAVFLR